MFNWLENTDPFLCIFLWVAADTAPSYVVFISQSYNQNGLQGKNIAQAVANMTGDDIDTVTKLSTVFVLCRAVCNGNGVLTTSTH